MIKFLAFFLLMSIFLACIPKGVGPTPRQIRKNPELKRLENRKVYPDSILSHSHIIEFPYRNIEEIKLSWKVVAGLKLKFTEVRKLRKLILSNARKYWEYRYPGQKIHSITLENVSVMDAQIFLDEGYPLLFYSAYDIKHRRRPYTFEGYDICLGYTGIKRPVDQRVSFKLNSGLRGYLDSESMVTGSLLDVPRLKNSQVQVLQILLFMPPGIGLKDIYNLLHKKYKQLGKTNYTLPVEDTMHPVGSVR
ncbi:MAG: hypothetical protein HQK83_00515 [Fibrobacteria bacterium]|nr:hypothetical protein [Fibrobacteria bacterium]